MCNGRYCLSFRSFYRLRAVPLFGGVCRASQERSLVRPPSLLEGPPAAHQHHFIISRFIFSDSREGLRRKGGNVRDLIL